MKCEMVSQRREKEMKNKIILAALAMILSLSFTVYGGDVLTEEQQLVAAAANQGLQSEELALVNQN